MSDTVIGPSAEISMLTGDDSSFRVLRNGNTNCRRGTSFDDKIFGRDADRKSSASLVNNSGKTSKSDDRFQTPASQAHEQLLMTAAAVRHELPINAASSNATAASYLDCL